MRVDLDAASNTGRDLEVNLESGDPGIGDAALTILAGHARTIGAQAAQVFRERNEEMTLLLAETQELSRMKEAVIVDVEQSNRELDSFSKTQIS